MNRTRSPIEVTLRLEPIAATTGGIELRTTALAEALAEKLEGLVVEGWEMQLTEVQSRSLWVVEL